MKNFYEPGAVRWKKYDSSLPDVRLYRPNKGWTAEAMMLDAHPITDKEFERAQWWIREEYRP